MTVFTIPASTVFAPTTAQGVPRGAEMGQTLVWGTEVERAITAAIAAGGLVFANKAALDAYLTPGANTGAWVVADATEANNGIYSKVGGTGTGSWTRRSALPAGETGAAGADGADGANGADGEDGDTTDTVVYRPGDTPAFFTDVITGAAPDLAPILDGAAVTNASGRAWRFSHNGARKRIATRWDMAVEPGVTYALRYALRRNVNTDDPWGDGVSFNVAWLDANKGLLSAVTISLTTATTGDGRITLQRTASLASGANLLIPAGTCYMRMYVDLYGVGGSTDIEVLNRWETNGLVGTKGDTGDKGWAAETAVATDGPNRAVLRIDDYIGGTGTKPAGAGQYIGPSGLVATAAEAVNIKGNEGAQGPRGVTWRGPWSSLTDYNPGDLVSDPDDDDVTVIWIALTAHDNEKPRDNPTDWDFFPGSFATTLDDGLITASVTETLDDGDLS